jgi:uncharacterized protein YjbJ (UPF0337 family)
MNTDRIAGTAKQAVGRIVGFFGKMVTDLEAVAGRRGKKAEGKVQDTVSDAKDTTRHAPKDTQ